MSSNALGQTQALELTVARESSCPRYALENDTSETEPKGSSCYGNVRRPKGAFGGERQVVERAT